LVCWRRGISVGRAHGKYLKGSSSKFMEGNRECNSRCAAAGETEGSVHLSNVGEQGSGAAGANGVPSVVIPLNYAQVSDYSINMSSSLARRFMRFCWKYCYNTTIMKKNECRF
jgi:hypothetical protein